MFVLLLILVLVAVLSGSGHLGPVGWVVAAVLVYAVTRRARGRGGHRSRSGVPEPEDYRDYRDYRDRQDRWARRYRRRNRGRRSREDRRDRAYRP